jgi:hypothetical protein
MKSRRFSLRLPILLATVVATVILRSIAVCRDMDFRYGYFNSHTLISISSWIVLGAILLLTVIALFEQKRDKLAPTYHTPATYVPVALVGIALIFVFKELIVRFSNTFDAATAPSSIYRAMLLICAILSLGCVVCFFIFTLTKELVDTRRAVALTVIALFAMIYAVYLYFSTELPLNAPNKIIDQSAYTLCALYFLYEARASLGRAMWRTYTVFGQIAALLCAYSSIPSLAVYFIEGKVISNSIYESVLTFTLFIFISARLILFTEFESTEMCDTVKAIKSTDVQEDAEVEAEEEPVAEDDEVKEETTE